MSTNSSKGRMPSLNELAAKMNMNSTSASQNTTTQPATTRPRLTASLLRTGSTASINTSASVATTIDSMAVNAPSTRSGSPLTVGSCDTPPASNRSSIAEPPSGSAEPPSGGEPLTTDKLEQLNQETGYETVAAPVRLTKVGYKNIPSLDAITARLAKARTLSIDGSAKPPEAQMVEDPKTPGLQVKATEHPLQFTWTMYHDAKPNLAYTPAPNAKKDADGPFSPHPAESGEYEAGLTVIGDFDTVELFCRYFNWLKPPSKLDKNSNYHLFKSGIKPMWEDPANQNGGKWVITMRNNPELLDRCWSWLTMALVGEELEEGDDICGAVVSLRSRDRIQVWTRSRDDVAKLNGIGKKLVKLLDISEADGISLEFQYNTDERPTPNKFLSIQSLPSSSFRPNFTHGVSQRGPIGGSPLAGPGETGGMGAFMTNGWKAPGKKG